MTQQSHASQFRLMADRVEHNQGSGFGGAAVIVPPAQGGEPVELLILDPKADPAQFWGAIYTRAQLEVNALQDRRQMQQGFGSLR